MAEKRLVRSKSDRMLAGVCGGIGEYFDVDSNIVRVIWIVITVLSGFFPGILIYILVWLIVPENGSEEPIEATYSIKSEDENQ
ncbi:MAG: PspC domain-containing protein [Methanomicrobiaceae archaeon]|nr:PspC domain-containing protein [Methanomicrobiaceae archaeon]